MKKCHGQRLEKGRRIHQGNFASSCFPLASRSWAVLGRERQWSQGDQLSLFVIPWLCQLAGRVTGWGLQLSTALASWICTLISIPSLQTRGDSLPLPFSFAHPQAPLEGHHWPGRGFVGGFAPWHHCKDLSPVGAAEDLSPLGAAGLSQFHSYLPGPQISFFFPFPGLLSCFPAVSTNLQLLPVHLKFHWYFGAHK